MHKRIWCGLWTVEYFLTNNAADIEITEFYYYSCSSFAVVGLNVVMRGVGTGEMHVDKQFMYEIFNV